jgi:alpha-mannosidase
VNKSSDETVVENPFILVSFDSNGRMTRLFDKVEKREVMKPNTLGNVFKYYEDIPLFWDAWDVEVFGLDFIDV